MPVLTLIKVYERPVITIESPGTQDSKYGFEGGRALKIGKTYHLITTEESGDPRYVKTRLGHWTSQDRHPLEADLDSLSIDRHSIGE